MVKSISAEELRKYFSGAGEYALIDVREQGEFSRGHQLLACSVPLSRMELVINDLVPALATPIVLVDDGPADKYQHAQRAAERLAEFGYTDVSILEGGMQGWREAGYRLFSGVNVVSKAFGEFVETEYNTPYIAPGALHEKIAKQEKLVIFDARPEEEFQRMNIPGAVNVPGSELVYRFFEMVPDDETLVVVNCAGRTRSIIGAQSLINARVPNPVTALKDGTMGWHLAGFELEHGRRQNLPTPSAQGTSRAEECAQRVAERFKVRKIDRTVLAGWQKESADRTLYLLDVRLPGEYLAGHLAGSRSAPGVQLIQATDEYLAVRNGRVILIDDNGIRAVMTASWLIQLGWPDVYVLEGGLAGEALVKGPHLPQIAGFKKAPAISAAALKQQLEGGNPIALIDVSTSREYRQAHIPGACWIIRSRLTRDLERFPTSQKFLLVSPDGILAHLAAAELQALRQQTPVEVLEGGLAAWIAAGYATEQGLTAPLSDLEDVWYKPYEFSDAPEAAMKEYLTWEVALVEGLAKDGSLTFKHYVATD